MRIYDLREKEVVNMCNCRILGCVVDLEFDTCTGCIRALIVPGPSKLCGFWGRASEFVIPWKCVRQIGPDIILVEVDEKEVLVKCQF